jgi:O-antigen polysaccharide polymerase Wzy
MEYVPSVSAHRRVDDWVFREHIRMVLAIFAAVSTVGLTWLAVRHEPLPFSDPRSAAIATVFFSASVIAATLIVRRLPALSFPSLFLAVTFVFTCSPLILFVLQGDEAFRSWEWVDMQTVLIAMTLVALAYSAFLLGAMLTRLPVPGERSAPIGRRQDPHAWALRYVGLGLYAVALLVIAGYTVTGGALTHAIQGGYSEFHGAKRAGEISQIAGVALSRLLPWSVLILAAVSRDQRSRRLVVLATIPAIAIMLAIGDRSGPVALMVVSASGLWLRGARIGWGRALGVGLLIAFLMPTILNLRTVPIAEWSVDTLERAATNQVEATNTYRSDLLGGFLLSTSSSYQTLMATVKAVPEQERFHLGSDYLASLVVAIPFRSAIFGPLDIDPRSFPPSQWVLSYLHPGRNAGPGFLQLAEAYLQFGAVGVLVLYALLGWGLVRLWRSVSANAWNVRAVALSLIVISETLIWVRNSSALGVRALAWGWIVVYALPAALEAMRRRSVRASERPRPVVEGSSA